jgi:hypothetical protein
MAGTWEGHAPDIQQPAPHKIVSLPRLIEGKSTFYDYHEGQAAAGPALRAALGRHWRGTKVRVCNGDVCIKDPIFLTDWCQCYWKTPTERLIDLDDVDFAKLAPLSKGWFNATVSRW